MNAALNVVKAMCAINAMNSEIREIAQRAVFTRSILDELENTSNPNQMQFGFIKQENKNENN